MELAVASDTAASEGSPEGDDELSDGGTPTGDLRVPCPRTASKTQGTLQGTAGSLVALHLVAVRGSWKSTESHRHPNSWVSGFQAPLAVARTRPLVTRRPPDQGLCAAYMMLLDFLPAVLGLVAGSLSLRCIAECPFPGFRPEI